jgi:hypothetical protein
MPCTTLRVDPQPVRVIFESMPYVVVRNRDGDGERAYGPFTPGTEPSLAECGPESQVHDPELLRVLSGLASQSPELPTREDTLAGG